MKNLENLSPFELGESNEEKAINYLINFLEEGNDNEKRLSASAITKLYPNFSKKCEQAIPFLIKNLQNSKPQVRQYTLKSLKNFNLSEDDLEIVKKLFKEEEKDYNKAIAAEILKLPEGYITEKLSVTNIKEINVENTTEEIGYIYFIKELFSGRIKIGKTKNLQQRLKLFSVKLPFEIELLHYVKTNNPSYVENLFHEFFEEKRVNGEWFELDVDDILWVLSGLYTKNINKYVINDNVIKTHTLNDLNYKKEETITPKQIPFLTNLITKNKITLTKSIDSLSKNEARELISYLSKGTQPTKETSLLIKNLNEKSN